MLRLFSARSLTSCRCPPCSGRVLPCTKYIKIWERQERFCAWSGMESEGLKRKREEDSPGEGEREEKCVKVGHSCPLCLGEDHEEWFKKVIKTKKTNYSAEYWKCKECALVFMDKSSYLTKEKEKERYDTHNNNPNDQGYVKFLRRVADPLLIEIGAEPKVGLDFGCGPGPCLSKLLEEHKHTVHLYDPFYFPDRAPLRPEAFDFITCTEVIEHVKDPAEVFGELRAWLKEGGVLAMMTSFVVERSKFDNWYYHRDQTHICFYSPETFNWVAKKWGFQLKIPAKDVVFLIKKS
eukprot:TRINITY_DN4637_c0_g1_i1.p1 TRINITY_DN4637_c0_g1~~TRINITY_DN4637_c0_g1_i1.p1  ORF type:complete len:293 (-),score=46.43 TRINITY_DN4637_c0_g1_i1:2-880(-)